jgi:hypothetical protein
MNAFLSDKVCLFQRLKTGPDSCHREVGKSGNIRGTESFRILPDQPVKFLKLRPVGSILQDLKIRIFDLRRKKPEIGINAALGIGGFLTKKFP